MKEAKRLEKENNIINAAEKIFSKVGFKNAKMEEIASEAGITKVTLYSYFQSKENLYLAITYKGVSRLNERFYEILNANRSKSGLESVVELFRCYAEFCQNNLLFAESIMEYFSLLRSPNDEKKQLRLTDAIKESIYYRKLQDIHNIPLKMTAKEIFRGVSDKSVRKDADPVMYTVFAWTTVTGYIKFLSAGSKKRPLFGVDSDRLLDIILDTVVKVLENKEEE